MSVGAWPNAAYHSWGEIKAGLVPGLARIADKCSKAFPDIPLLWMDEHAPHPLAGVFDDTNPGGTGSWALLRRAPNILMFNEAVRSALNGKVRASVPTFDVTLGRPGHKDYVHYNSKKVLRAEWDLIYEAIWDFFPQQ